MPLISSVYHRVRCYSRMICEYRNSRRMNDMVVSVEPPGGLEPLEQRLMLSTTFLINTNLDVIDPGDGALSLREAIQDADTEPGDDIIEFDTALTGTTITLDSTLGRLELDSNVEIRGLGADQLTINGADESQIFHITPTSVVSISHLSLTAGFYRNDPGAAIWNEGDAVLVNLHIYNNYSLEGAGGVGNAGNMIIHDSSICNNQGGGIGNRGDLTIINTTISGNYSDYTTGGIENTGTMTVIHSTITQNHNCFLDDYIGMDLYDIGSGIFNHDYYFNPITTIHNTIIAENYSGTAYPVEVNVNGDFDASSSHNLIRTAAADYVSGLEHGINGNQVGTSADPIDPELGSLSTHGGSTWVYSLLPGSSAINAGDNSFAVDHLSNPLAFDQRGDGYIRITGGTVDIGSFEVQSVSSPTNLQAEEGDGQVLLSWDLGSNPDVLYHKVYRSLTNGGPYGVVAIVFGGQNIIDRNVYNDTTYYYAISAVDVYGFESDMTSQVIATPHVPQPPAAPTDLTVTPYSSSQLYLEFLDHSDDEVGFIVERRAGDGDFEQVAILDVEMNKYMDFALDPLTAYTYRVASYNDAGQSQYTNEFSSLTYDTSIAMTYEAEDAFRAGPAVQAEHHGYTGMGYVDYLAASGQYIEWTVDVDLAGDYELIFRYALGYGDRPLEIQVNDVVIEPSLSFPSSGGWKDWGMVTTVATLNADANTVRATSIGYSGANVDSLTVFLVSAMSEQQPVFELTAAQSPAEDTSVTNHSAITSSWTATRLAAGHELEPILLRPVGGSLSGLLNDDGDNNGFFELL